ncbi:hypothetical protein HHI36_001976 [Cryptolaemus montrouzieri]|uniref:Reverse transcriptase domain-containing protein n=1 Tax=Cryptolaemus montrouzieri TaxID=559131 RepID=A0ABD2P965_9CUCU
MFIDDLLDVIDIPELMYADDLKIFLEIKTQRNCERLQEVIFVSDWCRSNCLYLNMSKCSVVSFTRKKMIQLFDYEIYETVLRRSNEAKDLGIIFDQKFTSSPHINYLFSSAFRVYGFIIRNGKKTLQL